MLYLNVKLISSIKDCMASFLPVPPALGSRGLLLQLPSGAGERSVPGVGCFLRKKPCHAIYPAKT